ncbi:unnamed protein product [Linum tenue]|uniref:Cytochrome c-553 n=1 Tax=Linum tenue TaxID=586396 RepID=A0AAV0GML6_9ROSI|nr:unnamed protein product [Linum tenue]
MWLLSSAVAPGSSSFRFPKAEMEGDSNILITSFAPPVVAAILALSPLAPVSPVSAAAMSGAEIQRGATLFRRSCIGCHDGGGNIIKSVSECSQNCSNELCVNFNYVTNGVETEDAIYQITYFGKARMPGFGETCSPRGQCTFGPRLKDEEIKMLAEFVKAQADQGWANNIPLTDDD